MELNELYTKLKGNIEHLAKDKLNQKINPKFLTLIVIVFLIFYGFYIFVIYKTQPESAYSALIKEAKKNKLELMDTRLPYNE